MKMGIYEVLFKGMKKGKILKNYNFFINVIYFIHHDTQTIIQNIFLYSALFFQGFYKMCGDH